MKALLLAFCLACLFALSSSASACDGCEAYLEAAADLEAGESLLIAENETVLFLYRAMNTELSEIQTCCGIQAHMIILDEETNLWYLRYPVPRLDEAVIGYHFMEWRENELLHHSPYEVWRGENAPEAPPYVNVLQGRLVTRHFESEALGESRELRIYLPPNYDSSQTYPVIYMADGGFAESAAFLLEQLIQDEEIPPMILVGAFASVDYRAEEYLPNLNSERFALHERFFTEELRLWAEDEFGASTDPTQRAVYGHSNGGVFAASMALLHPEIYGIAFPFSAGMNPFEAFPNSVIAPDLRLYFTAGTIETGFFENTRTLAERFSEAGAEVIFHERVGGHDFIIWGEEFYYAVKWAFGE